jgi:hypothetical protein
VPKLNATKGEVCDRTLPYQPLIASIMYQAVLTRPDIVSVNYLSQLNTCYNEERWEYAKRVVKYLKKN